MMRFSANECNRCVTNVWNPRRTSIWLYYEWSANIQTVEMGPTRLPPTPEEEEPPRQLSVEPQTPDTLKYEM